MTKTLARLADLEPAILAERPASADALGDLQRAIQLVNDGLVSGEPVDTMAARYVACMEALVVLASQQGSSLAQCRESLQEPIKGFSQFYNSQHPTWEKLPLWMSCLAGALKYYSKMATYHLGAISEAINDGARINLARTADDLLERHWADKVG
jgi:hypothetical protein